MAFNQTAAAPSHKMRRCLLMAFALIALALTALPTASFAGTDTAGNVLATDNDSNPSGVEGDLYWAGQALNLDDASIDRDNNCGRREPLHPRLHGGRRHPLGGTHYRYRQDHG